MSQKYGFRILSADANAVFAVPGGQFSVLEAADSNGEIWTSNPELIAHLSNCGVVVPIPAKGSTTKNRKEEAGS